MLRITARQVCQGEAGNVVDEAALARYEAPLALHASGVSSAQRHEAALRAMKRSLDRLH